MKRSTEEQDLRGEEKRGLGVRSVFNRSERGGAKGREEIITAYLP